MDKRRIFFWLLFLVTAAVLAVIPEFFEDPQDEVVVAVPRSGPLGDLLSGDRDVAGVAAPIVPASETPNDDGSAERSADEGGRRQPLVADLFAAHSWYVPPPPPPSPPTPPPPPPPPPPSAPPLPFVYLGKLDDAGQLRVFLANGERVHIVAAGDVIDGRYRVDQINGTQMILTYLPLNIAQTLIVGSRL